MPLRSIPSRFKRIFGSPLGLGGDRVSYRFFAGVLICACLGCNHLNDPFKDSSAVIDSEMTTASADDYMAGQHDYAPPRRDWRPTDVYYENGAVSHWPLWFEDPFEDKGNGFTSPSDRDAPDNVFAWNGADYVAMPYSIGRMLVNTVAYPLSAIVTPPGTLMESDGRISKGLFWYDHDARRSNPSLREPPDANDLSKKTAKFADEEGEGETKPSPTSGAAG